VSAVRIISRPSFTRAKASTKSTTSGSVSRPAMSSVPTITLGGLKKWRPRKFRRNDSPRPSPRALMERPEVTVATIASSRRSFSTRSNISFLTAKSSVRASKTRSASATADSRSCS
jgi:hypothetical protein